MRSPLWSSHLYLKVTFLCPVIENFIWIEPLFRGHLSYSTSFSLSDKWPLNTGLTIIVTIWTDIFEELLSFYDFFILNGICHDYLLPYGDVNIAYIYLDYLWRRCFLYVTISLTSLRWVGPKFLLKELMVSIHLPWMGGFSREFVITVQSFIRL